MARPPLAAPALALALAALAACRVDVDGAPCAGAGTSADCPDGQACGNDLRCSARALACAASRCAPGARECAGAIARACSAADPVCGRWTSDDCAARGMECGTQGSSACECPAFAGTTLVADASARTVRGEPPFPTGQESPPECRFGRLGDALAAAALAPAAVVRAVANGAAAPEFGAATGEGWPLAVASTVRVAGATAFGPASIRGAPGVPLLVALAGALEDVAVDADGATTAVQAGAAGARLLRVDVAGATGAALEISADPAAAATVEVLGGSYRASGVGIWIRAGRVTVAPDPALVSSAVASGHPGATAVAANVGDGIVIGGAPDRGLPFPMREVSAAIERVRVEANGGAGILLGGLATPTRIRIASCDVRANGAVDPAAYGTRGRKAGGVLVALVPGPQLTFVGNRVWGNARDQLAFEAGTWSIAAPSCGPDSNVFACVAPGTASCDDAPACAVAVSENGGSVNARYNVWPAPGPAYPYVTLNGVTVDYALYCGSTAPGVPATPSCD